MNGKVREIFDSALVVANIALLGVIAGLLYPGKGAPEFVAFFSAVLIAGVLGVRIYKEYSALKVVKKSPIKLRIGGINFYFDDPQLAEAFKKSFENTEDPEVYTVLKGLPRNVFIGSYPSEVETRRGELVGIINTDLAKSELIFGYLKELQRNPLYWLDFTSTTGLLARLLVPTVLILLNASVAVIIATVVIAGILFGAVDNMGEQYVPL